MRRILGAWGLLIVTALPAQQATLLQEGLGESWRDQRPTALCDPLAIAESVSGAATSEEAVADVHATPVDAVAGSVSNASNQGSEIDLAQRAGALIFKDPQACPYQPMDIPPVLQNVILLTIPARQPPGAFMGPLLSLWGGLQRHKAPAVVARDLFNMLPRLIVRLGRIYTGAPQTALSKGSDRPESLGEDFLALFYGESWTLMPEAVRHARVRTLEIVLLTQVDRGMDAATQGVCQAAAAGVDIAGAVGIGAQMAFKDPQSCAAALQMLRRIEKPEHVPAFMAQASHADPLQRFPGLGTQEQSSDGSLVKREVIALLTVLQEARSSFPAEAENLLQVALALEQCIAQDPVCRKNNLRPTADLYTAVAYVLLGIPEALHDTVSLMGRCVGWMAHGLKEKSHVDMHAHIGNISGIKAH